MRPGCDRPAAARLSYDTISCQVWLDQMPERLGPVQEICQFHAERLTVPRGWTLCDRRVDAPALFEPDAKAVRLDAVTEAPVRATPRRAARNARGPMPRPDEVAPRRAGRRRHPAATARQLFADATPDLDSDLDDELAALSVLDLDTDLDATADTALTTAADVVVDDVVAAEPAPVVAISEPEPDEVGEVDVAARPAPARVRTGGLEALIGITVDEAAANGTPGHAEVMAEIVSVDPDDELPESLRATSPLLARAFRATGPQRSVLSDDLAVPAVEHEGDNADAGRAPRT
jgi:hypothetical protein